MRVALVCSVAVRMREKVLCSKGRTTEPSKEPGEFGCSIICGLFYLFFYPFFYQRFCESSVADSRRILDAQAMFKHLIILRLIFGSVSLANLGKELFIEKIVHKAYIKVDEEGTEAAAVTAVVVTMTALPGSEPSFVVDHPFI